MRPMEKRHSNVNDIRHENIRSNMVIAIIRYANNKRHFHHIWFIVHHNSLPACQSSPEKIDLIPLLRIRSQFYWFQRNTAVDHEWIICS